LDKTVQNVNIDSARVIRLALKFVELLVRKRKGRSSLTDILNEYWTARFVVLYYENLLGGSLVFDNDAEIVAFYKEWIRKNTEGQ
jgi:hypothetical protein